MRVAYPDAVIMVFCKAPIPGQVKTRLMPPLTAEEASQLHRELTERTLLTVSQKSLCQLQLWCSPSTGHPFFNQLAQKYPVGLHLQQGEDLGQRMHFAINHALTSFNKAIIIGCDCPSLAPDDLEQSIIGLDEGVQCTIAPAEDGGYVLIGLKQSQPALFENMPWGTDKVLNSTRAKLQSNNIGYLELGMQWDLDNEQDLKRYLALKGNKQ